MDINILPYAMASQGAQDLQAQLTGTTVNDQPVHVRRYRPDSPYVRRLASAGFTAPSKKTMIIRWGNAPINSAALPDTLQNLLTLNVTDLSPYINKKLFFETYRNFDHTPRYFTDRNAVQTILNESTPGSGPLWVERHILDGHSGAGIRLLSAGDSTSADGKLWTKYVKKQREFRAHFFRFGPGPNDTALHFAEKLLRRGADDTPAVNRFQIRNWDNGWIYATQITRGVPDIVDRVARAFVSYSKTTLDFGAIDLIYNVANNAAFVLEVNTAPGITGQTTRFYKNQVQLMLQTHDWLSAKTKIKSFFVFSPSDEVTATDDFEDDFDDNLFDEENEEDHGE
jgi:hypothetical protein